MSRAATALFLPCRAGSTRVPNKNTRPFAGHAGGLLGVKLDQLEAVRGLDAVVLDSNDPLVLERGRARQASWHGHAALIVRERPDALGQSATTTDALIAYALDTVEADVLAWTHVTSPLADAGVYERGLAAFVGRDPRRHDSLMAVTPLRTFLWSADGPVNYRPDPVRWPRTQDIAPLYEVNSALFIVPREIARRRGDRVGERPLLFEMTHLEAVDVDWEQDFLIAEAVWRSRR